MIYIALPILDELQHLPALLNCIASQTYIHYKLVVCVNQPDSWWDDAEKQVRCLNNQACIDLVKRQSNIQQEIMDRSSKGLGWQGKERGIGWARKLIMDSISKQANDQDIIVSLDADCEFSSAYFQSIVDTLTGNPKAIALSVPYYHKLTSEDAQNRAILRYEIYMRYYAINLFRINNPYALTALGSAMALPVWGYRKIRGIAPKYAGEDFYFLQQLAKAGQLLHTNTETVYPSGRLSDRVDVGTGPALRKGMQQLWSSYPIYPYQLFDTIAETYALFDELYYKDLDTPVTEFLQKQLNTKDLWSALRKNFKTQQQFTKACAERLDGLRILQYLKANHTQSDISDDQNLQVFIKQYYPQSEFAKSSFTHSTTEELDRLRNFLHQEELLLRRKP